MDVASAEKSVGVSDWGREEKDELFTWWERNVKGEKSRNAFGEEVSHCHCSNQGVPKVPVHACMMLSRVQLSATPQRLFVPPRKLELMVRDANEALGRHSMHSGPYMAPAFTYLPRENLSQCPLSVYVC